eukprot:CAMPEP_0202025752 /NCGR_PEP_ID=MMETSP0905-20130828/57231_1 /ASSEMBLY_ACC=CAM_ASM_000554 /TAXON_ID=420261 /ORGANISM="Thalassiosira antarctica, Strain CCMP982" /LENGTH=202 /DNA_ID=CAMNT_0048588763 /DNA_START=159 /DNA_END=764 /DNA_ORIENTATION=-
MSMRFITYIIPLFPVLQYHSIPISAFSTLKNVVLRHRGNAVPNNNADGNYRLFSTGYQFDNFSEEELDVDQSTGGGGDPSHGRRATRAIGGESRWAVAGLLGVATSQLHVSKALAEGVVGLDDALDDVALLTIPIGIALTVTFMISGIDKEKYNREEWQYLDLDIVPYGLREEAQDYSMPADTPSGNTYLQASATSRSFYQY